MTLCGYRTCLVHFGLVRFFYGDPDGVSRQSLAGDPEEVQEATGKPPVGRTSFEQKLYPFAVICKADDCAAIESQSNHIPLAQ